MTAHPTARPSRHDAVAGLLVALVALPLCLGIAVASGFPPIAGVWTAIVGGLVTSLLGGAPLTIKGPAAGLIAVVLGTVTELGGGDPAAGVRAALAVGVAAGLVQVLLSRLPVDAWASAFPPSVLQGMLAAIGVLLVTRQLPVWLGAPAASGSTVERLLALPAQVADANLAVLSVGLSATLVLVLWPRLPARLTRWLPAPLLALVAAAIAGQALGVATGAEHRWFGHTQVVGVDPWLRLPARPLTTLLTPDFARLLEPRTWWFVATWSWIGSVESVLSARAVDRLDPLRRTPDLSRDLFAVGAANALAALTGGLPMISEIVRSTANVKAGGRTRWANAAHGAALLALVTVAPGLLSYIPMAGLAGLLLYTATLLAAQGPLTDPTARRAEHLLPYAVTAVTCVTTDLLVGVVCGLAASVLLRRLRAPGRAATGLATAVTDR